MNKLRPTEQEIQFAKQLERERIEDKMYPLRKYSKTQLKAELLRRKRK